MFSNILKTALFLFAMMAVWHPLRAQSYASILKDAEEAYQNREYWTANKYYQIALEKSEDDPAVWFQYAKSAWQVHDFEEAEKYFTKILESHDRKNFQMTRFWLGQVKKNLGKYEEAIELFTVFSELNLDEYYSYWAANEIKVCQWAMEQPPSDENIQIDLLDENINSNFSETAPFEMGNHLYYSSDKSIFAKDKHDPQRHINKMMVSKNLERSRSVPNEFVEDGLHFCHTAFSLDWQRMYFTVCEYTDGENTKCEIYYRDQDKKGDWLDTSVRLPDYINLNGYTSTQPAIGYDSTTQTEILYFVSDRPGGSGKMDLWVCEIKDNAFSKPINFWQFNTPENEITPNFHLESQTFTFSSDGYRGFGGYDIFYCKKIGQQWNMVTNIGKPINSSYDDIYFSKNTIGNRAYFSSNRPGSFMPRNSHVGCCFDIYKVYFR